MRDMMIMCMSATCDHYLIICVFAQEDIGMVCVCVCVCVCVKVKVKVEVKVCLLNDACSLRILEWCVCACVCASLGGYECK